LSSKEFPLQGSSHPPRAGNRAYLVRVTFQIDSLPSFAGAAQATTLNLDALPSGVAAPGTYAAQGVPIDPTGYQAEANINFINGINNDICGQRPGCYNNGYYPTQEETTVDFTNAESQRVVLF
jgi:hypothetical protein